jgi:DNA-binding LacI/PurR family transcriptional regulator
MTAAGNDANICTVNFAFDGGAPDIRPLFGNLQTPTAFFAYNDVAATALERALTALGLKTPGHVSVAGYDNTLLARGASGLTSVDQPRDELGLLAMTTLIGRILGETTLTHTVLEPHVVARESTAPLQAKD